MEAAADTLLRIKDVAAMCSVSAQTVRRWAARGILPPPVRIGGKDLFWRESDIVQWIRATFRQPLPEMNLPCEPKE